MNKLACIALLSTLTPLRTQEPPDAADRVAKATGLHFAIIESKIRRSIISTDTPYGFKVKAVQAGSPAAGAGIERGWLLMKWAGHPIHEVEEIDTWLWELPSGAVVEVEYARRKKTRGWSRDPWEDGKVRLTIARDHPLRALGIGVFGGEAVEGVPRGVPVRSVVEDSAAAAAHLRAGDVIIGWNGVEVHDLGGLREPFIDSHGAKVIPVRYYRRDGDRWSEHEVQLLPPQKDSGR